MWQAGLAPPLCLQGQAQGSHVVDHPWQVSDDMSQRTTVRRQRREGLMLPSGGDIQAESQRTVGFRPSKTGGRTAARVEETAEAKTWAEPRGRYSRSGVTCRAGARPGSAGFFWNCEVLRNFQNMASNLICLELVSATPRFMQEAGGRRVCWRPDLTPST